MSMSGDLGDIDLDLISDTSDIVGIGVEVKRGSEIFLPKINRLNSEYLRNKRYTDIIKLSIIKKLAI